MGAAVELKLSAEAVEKLIRDGLPEAANGGIRVEALAPGTACVRLPFGRHMLRPGNRVSGPTLFSAVDTAMYAAVLAHVGPQLMAVTADVNLHFLRAAAPRDILAEARILKLGRRLVTMSVEVRAEGEAVAAFATGAYALPPQ